MDSPETNAEEREYPADSPREWSRIASWLTLAVIAGLGLLCLTLFRASGSGPEHPAIGRAIPNFELQPLTGHSTPVERADLAGQVVLLNFWGTWCPPCRMELPHILDLAVKYSTRRDFRLLAVSCGTARDTDIESLREETDAFLKKSQVDLDTYADQYGAARRAVSRVTSIADGEFNLPTTILLDRQGVIRGFWQGYLPQYIEEMQERVEKTLGPRQVAQTR